MTNLVEGVVVQTGLAIVSIHRWELALIPALRDACRDVEVIARHGEQILSLASAVWNIMLKLARLGCGLSIARTIIIPNEFAGTVVCAGLVVVEQNGVPVLLSRAHVEHGLRRPRHVSWSNIARGWRRRS